MKELTYLPFLLFSIANGFSVSSLTRSGRNKLQPLGAASNLDGKPLLDTSNNRRDALSSLLLLTSAGIFGAASSFQAPTGDARLLGSVREALALIESECDKRFLHGVVASGYKFMYRCIPTDDSSFPIITQSKASDVILSSGDFASLERNMADRVIKPSTAHLAYTSPDQIVDGVAASVWPLGGDVHFAWSEDGDLLQNSAGKVIVDGVDCGRMSLEDALEGCDREIMFRADRYLAVPVSLEADLVNGLRSAFII